MRRHSSERETARQAVGSKPKRPRLSATDGKIAQKQGIWNSIPDGLSKREHLESARELGHPFQRDIEIDSDLQGACDAVLRDGSYLNEWRRSQLSKLRQAAENFSKESKFGERSARSTSIHPNPNLRPGFFRHLLEKYEYSDPGAADLCQQQASRRCEPGPDDPAKGWLCCSPLLSPSESTKNCCAGKGALVAHTSTSAGPYTSAPNRQPHRRPTPAPFPQATRGQLHREEDSAAAAPKADQAG